MAGAVPVPPGGSCEGFWGTGFWGLNPPGFAFVPHSFGTGCELCEGPFWEEVPETKVQLLSISALPCLVFSGMVEGAAPLCILGVSAHPSLPCGSRRQIQAAEVREEKGQSQIPPPVGLKVQKEISV